MRFASLPMYDLVEVRLATRAWWTGLARAFATAGIEDVPRELSTPAESIAHWQDPKLLFSQTCGRPYTQQLASEVRLVATPCYTASGCEGPRYRSLLLSSETSSKPDLADLRDAKIAVNSFDSQSGWVALCAAVTTRGGQPDFAETLVTGSHAESIAAVARGDAQLCAVDCVTHALLKTHAPEMVAGVKPVDQSPAAAGLPYITSRTTEVDDVARLRDGLRNALDSRDLASTRDTLLIADCEILDDADYDVIRAMARDCATADHPKPT